MITDKSIYFDYYETVLGTGALLFSEKGIRHLLLPVEKVELLDRTIREKQGNCRRNQCGEWDGVKEVLYRYFEGYETGFGQFGPNLDLRGFSVFEKKVLGIASYIPYGSIWSYKHLAEMIGKPSAFRAVGNVMAKNPVPILVPCHRVVRSDLRMGGFSSGTEWKRRLLKLEGVSVSPNGKCTSKIKKLKIAAETPS
jgi:methylated-DNA-[protein]-cysteine S-methyltransferase